MYVYMFSSFFLNSYRWRCFGYRVSADSCQRIELIAFACDMPCVAVFVRIQCHYCICDSFYTYLIKQTQTSMSAFY